MSVLDELKEMQREIEKLEEKHAELIDSAEKVIEEIHRKKNTIFMASRVAAHYEEQMKEQRELTNESFRTLYVKWKAGGATDADFNQYAEDASYEFEIESPPNEKEDEAAA